MTAQLLLSLSILVALHELGHLLAAKAFGMRVEKYSIGFPPKIFGVQYGETEYSLGAIPLGGFVKISGMIDESMDTDAMKEPPKDYEFRSKPAWQRLIVMMGGIIVNVITGVLIFIFITYFNGELHLSKDQLNENGIVAYDLGQEVGFQTGDKIIAINGADYEWYSDIRSADVMLEDNSFYTVDRDGEKLDIFIPIDLIEKLSDREAAANYIDFRAPFSIGQVSPGSSADEMGLLTGDRILTFNGQEINYYDEFEAAKQENIDSDITITVQRGEDIEVLNGHLDETGVLGFQANREIEFTQVDFSFAEAIPRGTKEAFSVVWVNAKALGRIFTGKMDPSKSLMGPIRIATEVFGGTWDWLRFWKITGLLSMVLAFMNFLPIPALDGGHVMFLMYEIVSGRKPSDKFLENAQKVGMMLLLLLMAFVLFNDIFRLDFIQGLFGA